MNVLMRNALVGTAVPKHGRVVACEKDEKWPRIGSPYWHAAGVADRIDLRIGPAADTLADMLQAGEAGCYDLAFIDANKSQYDEYYEAALVLLRPGGLVVLDNVRLALGHSPFPNVMTLTAVWFSAIITGTVERRRRQPRCH